MVADRTLDARAVTSDRMVTSGESRSPARSCHRGVTCGVPGQAAGHAIFASKESEIKSSMAINYPPMVMARAVDAERGVQPPCSLRSH
jgi:hypothetical protein